MGTKPQESSSISCERDQAISYLLGRIDYEKSTHIPYSDRVFRLDKVRHFLSLLGSPQIGLPVVHVAGSKGKGSTAATLAGILQAAGYRVGLYTSPHLTRFEERICVGGSPCTDRQLVQLVNQIRGPVQDFDRLIEAAVPDGRLTFFELTTAMAFLHFRQEQVDIAVMEVGLGGRLDATNVCEPVVSIITSISHDHTDVLGPTLADIAREKAGIIRPGVPVVSGVLRLSPQSVVAQAAQDKQAPLWQLGRDFDFEYDPPVHLEERAQPGWLKVQFQRGLQMAATRWPLALPGRHQAANSAVAVAAIQVLRDAGWRIPEASLGQGLESMTWPCRIEVVRRRPTVILDTAHNGASIAALVATLRESFSADKKVAIFAVSRGKDVRTMLRRMSCEFDQLILTQYQTNPRAMPVDELAALVPDPFAAKCVIRQTPEQAWDDAQTHLNERDLLCVTGSFYLTAELEKLARHANPR